MPRKTRSSSTILSEDPILSPIKPRSKRKGAPLSIPDNEETLPKAKRIATQSKKNEKSTATKQKAAQVEEVAKSETVSIKRGRKRKVIEDPIQIENKEEILSEPLKKRGRKSMTTDGNEKNDKVSSPLIPQKKRGRKSNIVKEEEKENGLPQRRGKKSKTEIDSKSATEDKKKVAKKDIKATTTKRKKKEESEEPKTPKPKRIPKKSRRESLSKLPTLVSPTDLRGVLKEPSPIKKNRRTSLGAGPPRVRIITPEEEQLFLTKHLPGVDFYQTGHLTPNRTVKDSDNIEGNEADTSQDSVIPLDIITAGLFFWTISILLWTPQKELERLPEIIVENCQPLIDEGSKFFASLLS